MIYLEIISFTWYFLLWPCHLSIWSKPHTQIVCESYAHSPNSFIYIIKHFTCIQKQIKTGNKYEPNPATDVIRRQIL